MVVVAAVGLFVVVESLEEVELVDALVLELELDVLVMVPPRPLKM